MCNEPDFDLPESFLEKVRQNAGCERSALGIPPAPESEALIRKIAEQTGLPSAAVSAALLEEGVAALKGRGILF